MSFGYKTVIPNPASVSSSNDNIITLAHLNERSRRSSHLAKGHGVSCTRSNSNMRKHSMPESRRGSFMLRLMAIDERHGKQRKEKELWIARRKSESERRASLVAISQGLSFLEESKLQARWTSKKTSDEFNGPKSFYETSTESSQHSDPKLPSLSGAQSFCFSKPLDSKEANSYVTLIRAKQERKRNQTEQHDFSDKVSTQDVPDQGSLFNYFTQKPLRLPPLLLPRIYSVQPRPLKQRAFLAPTKLPGLITDSEWDELLDCRYIRHAPARLNFR